jgi:hypothetical protein
MGLGVEKREHDRKGRITKEAVFCADELPK